MSWQGGSLHAYALINAIGAHQRLTTSFVVESYHLMAATLPLTISRVEGSHERQAFRLSELFCAPRIPYKALCVIWRTYSSFIPSNGGDARTRLPSFPPHALMDFTTRERSAASHCAMTRSVDGPCTGFTFDMVANSRFERRRRASAALPSAGPGPLLLCVIVQRTQVAGGMSRERSCQAQDPSESDVR